MHPPILRCLVPGAQPAVGPLAEPGEIAPVPALLAIETLTAYLRRTDPRTENSGTWRDFVTDCEIGDPVLLERCAEALTSGRRAARARQQMVRTAIQDEASRVRDTSAAHWQMRLRLGS